MTAKKRATKRVTAKKKTKGTPHIIELYDERTRVRTGAPRKILEFKSDEDYALGSTIKNQGKSYRVHDKIREKNRTKYYVK